MLMRERGDDLDHVLDEPEGRRRGDAEVARWHDGAGVAGVHDAGPPLELSLRHQSRRLLQPVSWLLVCLLLDVSCEGVQRK